MHTKLLPKRVIFNSLKKYHVKQEIRISEEGNQ